MPKKEYDQKVKPKSHTEHWEEHYSFSEGNDDKSGIKAFDPRPGKDRPCTHNKINELDH